MLQLSHWERFAGGTAGTDCCNPHICINQLYQSALVITRIMFSAEHGAQMKIFFVAAAILIPTASYAADMAVKAPPPSAVYNWTGFYIGGFVGGTGADRNASASEPLSAAGRYDGPNRLDTSYGLGSSFIGGGTVGYNWQKHGSNLVLGIEGEAGYIHLSGSRQDVNAVLNGIGLPDSVNSTRLGDAYGVIAGRVDR
ncbi:hypothetical protein JJE66_14345 [Bradyrhizobium diazoefficiens]|uniref:outer membrane protein n=1 Tax=Bradyrhizobium diazoefficiens TaxID=1355477 RepID=UPI00190D6E89|nr:hypothetical protein [Bradyrhizobium diazoefficiens]MBK3662424.1 hypothetical protein [Bradyrhizobium diazoefficiens]